MNHKLKILMCSEASFLKSGFGTYAHEILKRLHATGKYEIAEFASYGRVNDPNDSSIHWKYYANAVPDSDPRHKEYMSSSENQFGRWRFERVLLDFQPDIVFDVRDYWMTSYQQLSPLRPFFHWVLMPTVDSAPQQEEWIDTFIHADAIFTYSDFGRDTLLQQSNNKINYIDTASPGVNLDVFRPMPNTKEIKQSLGLPVDSYIIGSIMRNQKRKLFPELFSSIRQYLDKCYKTDYDLGKKTYFYLHTSYPDAGWEIPELLKEYKVGNKVYFTYACRNCGHYFSSLFTHPNQYCKRCGNKACTMPNVSNGISSINLSHIINTFDLYVQYAICEGFGMPQVEAGACGVPIASVDYSAMSDVVRKLNGYPIKVNQYFKELETKAIRTYPDNNSLVDIIFEYCNMPDILKQQKKHETRILTEKYYNWDDIAQKWQNYFDTVKLTGIQGQWHKPLQYMPNIEKNNNSVNNYEWTLSTIASHMPDHQIKSSMTMLNMIKNLDYQFVTNGMSHSPYSKDNMIDTLNTLINNNNLIAQAQNNHDNLTKDDYIQYAHMKDSIK